MRKQTKPRAGPGNERLAPSRLNYLPLPARYVNHASLVNHLALEACCVEEGNKDALNRMSSVLYLCYLIHESESSPAPVDVFIDAESVLDAAVRRACRSGIWRIERIDRAPLARLLLLHDGQLASIPTRVYLSAAERLNRLLLGKDPVSPLARGTVVQSSSGQSIECTRQQEEENAKQISRMP